MTIKLLEKKISRIAHQLNELRNELDLIKMRKSKKHDFSEWEKLAHEVSKRWTGKADAVEEIRFQRSKNG